MMEQEIRVWLFGRKHLASLLRRRVGGSKRSDFFFVFLLTVCYVNVYMNRVDLILARA